VAEVKRGARAPATIAVALSFALACVLPSCAPADGAPSGITRQAIVGGEESDESQDAVVLLMHYDALQTAGGTGGCTGVMLTPRLVLTARHCVSATEGRVACNEEGEADLGGAVQGDHRPNSLFVFAGRTRPDFLTGLANAGRGAEILTTGATTICNNDIALLLLEKPLEGAKTAPVRLDSGARQGEPLTVVGWGVTEDAPQPETRKQRTGVPVRSVGPDIGIGPAEFRAGEGTCAGDSGGPAFADTGAVLGVLSRGGNGRGADPGTAEACIDGDNVFVSTSGHRDLLLRGYERAGQRPWHEGRPDPTLEPEDSGCALAPSAPKAPDGGPAAWLSIVWLVALSFVRRRRA
jgi:hypothetical protein